MPRPKAITTEPRHLPDGRIVDEVLLPRDLLPAIHGLLDDSGSQLSTLSSRLESLCDSIYDLPPALARAVINWRELGLDADDCAARLENLFNGCIAGRRG